MFSILADIFHANGQSKVQNLELNVSRVFRLNFIGPECSFNNLIHSVNKHLSRKINVSKVTCL